MFESGNGGNDLMIAWICTFIACLGFGSNYLPVKKCDTRDGQFFSLMVACGIFLVGFIQWLCFGLYKFEPIAMLGGVIWAAGNLFEPFLVQRLGLGVGQLVWGATNMLTGWATGMFGLFGIDKAPVEYRNLNFIGVGIAIIALGFFTQMGAEAEPTPTKQNPDEEDPERRNVSGSFNAPLTTEGTAQKTVSGFFPGFFVALAAGVLFGSNFDPPTRLQQIGPPEHSEDSMDYVISHFSGVLVFTILAFGCFKLLSPSCYIGKDVVAPGLIAGILWGIAQVCWFKANAVLSYVVAFPIIVGIPGVIAAVWGVVLFGENRGRKNMALLGIIIFLQAVSLICIAMSKGDA
jgi:glucose uptake protein GlcU